MDLPRFIFQAEENLVEKPWGGRWIAMLKSLEGDKIGESWEFSTHPSRPSYVMVRGKKISLVDLIQIARKEILGNIDSGTLPILVKFLDVEGKISIQVHPTSEIARILGEREVGKNEAWIILNGGSVYIGFKENVGKNIFEMPPAEILGKMNRFEAKYLDSFRIPAGTIHFAENTKILEISTNSNLTYRIYDFEGRKTQAEKAIKALKMQRTRIEEVRGERGKISMEEFEAEILHLEGCLDLSTMGVFNILISLEGSAILRSEGEVSELKRGYSCLIPAITGIYTIESDKAVIGKIYAK